ncbi:hypothetical protein ACI65C_003948 [Semiaphis heraclei]
MDLNTLLLPNHLSVFSLGAYLGPDFTDEERSNAGTRGESLCIHFGIIPSEFDIPQCHCGRPLYRVSDYTRKLSGHGVVNHTTNFLEPPKNLPPFWVPAGRFSPECLDKQWEGAPPNNRLALIRYHTQHIERAWRELKRILTRCNSKSVADSYIGEWMYRTNILDRCGSVQDQFSSLQNYNHHHYLPTSPTLEAPFLSPFASLASPVLSYQINHPKEEFSSSRNKNNLKSKNKSAVEADNCVAEYFKAKKARLEANLVTYSYNTENKEALKMI